jgi:predicted molibdopterin-dependent oxidoreductase YjgC
MPNQVTIRIDDAEISVDTGTSVAAAIINAGKSRVRRSIHGEARGPVCGMGICYECRASIDGVPHQRTCMVMCAEGMVIKTDA